MECLCTNWIDSLNQYSGLISALVNAVLAFFTGGLAWLSYHLSHRQDEFAREQAALEMDRDQPLFCITLTTEEDSDDGRRGTEVLSIVNVGTKPLQPCNVQKDMFIELTKDNGLDKKTIYAHIWDYFFFVKQKDNLEEKEVLTARMPGNNRIYSGICYEAFQDGKQADGYRYLVEKVILVKIDYIDIHHNKKEKFYCNGKEINKEKYNKIYEESYKQDHQLSLQTVSYAKLKELIDKE